MDYWEWMREKVLLERQLQELRRWLDKVMEQGL